MGSSMLFLVCLMALLPMFMSNKNPEEIGTQILTAEQFCELLKNLSSFAQGINCIDLFEDDDTVKKITDALSRKPPNPEVNQRDENIELNHILLGFITDQVRNLVEDAGHEPPAEVPVVRAGRSAADNVARDLARHGERQRHRNGGRGSGERRGGGGWRGGALPPPGAPLLTPILNGLPIIAPVASTPAPPVSGRKRSLERDGMFKRQLQTQPVLVSSTTKSAPRKLQQGDVTRRVPFNVDQFGIKGNQKSDGKSQVTPEVLSGSTLTPTSAKPSVAVKEGKARSRPNTNPRIFPQRG